MTGLPRNLQFAAVILSGSEGSMHFARVGNPAGASEMHGSFTPRLRRSIQDDNRSGYAKLRSREGRKSVLLFFRISAALALN
jgi:hypothetical protein